MGDSREIFATFIGALVAVVLQVAVAPNIALFGAVPNFMLAYCLVIAIARPQSAGLVMPFALGLVFDLLSASPVGAMSFLLVLASFAASRIFSVVDNGTLFMPLSILIVVTLAVEMAYGIFLLSSGLSVSPIEAFFYRGLPCTLYDAALGLLMFPVATRFIVGSQKPDMPPLR
ncbi:MAG: rod shape-determining protein MreD [Eggerthellaceae bacterium]|nr:rod shape-determining protein MreD [Eggerthellaceae bacterium]